MRNSGAGRKTASGSEMDEVEQLLQAAQDDVLLKLSLNSHISRGSSHSLDPDLSRRFQALRTRPSPPKPSPPTPTPTPTPTPLPPNSNIQQTLPPLPHVDDELKTVLGDDLSARFAALRGSLNPSSSSSSSSSSPPVASSLSQTLPGPSIARCLGDRDSSGSNPDNEEDEVEKVIQWAKDAARLDPSPPSDDDGGDDGGDDDTNTENSSDDDQCDLDEKAKGTKNRTRQGRNPKRIFTFLSGHRRK